MKIEVEIDRKLCRGCLVCAQHCPEEKCLVFKKGVGMVWEDNNCWGCDNCVDACPVGAITIRRFQDGKEFSVTTKKGTNQGTKAGRVETKKPTPLDAASSRLAKRVDEVKAQAIEDIGKAETELARLEADAKRVEEKYGDGLPYEYGRVFAQALAHKDTIKTCALEIGRCLLRIKAGSPRGEYLTALREMEIAEKTAFKYQLAFLKFGATKNLKSLPITKMNALAFLAAAEIEELDVTGKLEKGSLGSITARDLAECSTRELAAKIDRLLERQKKSEDAYFKVKNELEELKRGGGTGAEFDRRTAAIGRLLTGLLELDLSEVEMRALDRFLGIAHLSLNKLWKRAHPELAARVPDGDLVEGRAEARKRAGKHLEPITPESVREAAEDIGAVAANSLEEMPDDFPLLAVEPPQAVEPPTDDQPEDDGPSDEELAGIIADSLTDEE